MNTRIFLLLNNAPVYFLDVECINLDLFFFHKNVNSSFQPLDQLGIKAFKQKHEKKLSDEIIFEVDFENNEKLSFLEIFLKISFFDATCFIKDAWGVLAGRR